ncbi:MAG: SCP2 sterol-binding domain-containing protein [Gammaproteobacteria bacterium]
MNLQTHAVLNNADKTRQPGVRKAVKKIDSSLLRDICLGAGADDAGFVEIDRVEIDAQRADILAVLPQTRSLISFVVKMNRGPIRSPARSVANLEFHHINDKTNETGHRIVASLENNGIHAINPAMGFPMEMQNFPEKMWVVSHKPVAVAAGLGRMGIHRNVIHPRFGNFILLGTVLMDAGVTDYSQPVDYNPCLSCKLCVSACPVGALSPDGDFNFSACYTHNYREFMGGFSNWVETIAGSNSSSDYRRKVTDSETVSMWQSLSYGANYKAAYCMAVCPAGEDVISPFLADRPEYLQEVVRPLQRKQEPVYVVQDSDAEAYVARRFPHKTIRRVENVLRPTSIKTFLQGLPLLFQRDRSRGLDNTYHFRFTGADTQETTVVIRDNTLEVSKGHTGTPDILITADAEVWIKFLRKEINIVWALIRRKIRIKGNPGLLLDFGKCFLA